MDSQKQRAFLAALAQTGNITGAARAAGIDRTAHYRWLNGDAHGSYREAVDAAMQEAGERLEAEARRRAVEGIERFDAKGRPYRHYSDILLIFLLKGMFPQKYRDNVSINVDSQSEAVAQQLGVDKSEVDKALAEARRILGGKGGGTTFQE